MIDGVAGAAVGLLLGVVVALSASSVVATLVGTLAALLGVFLGLERPSDAGNESTGGTPSPARPTGSGIRVVTFSLSCVVAILVGLLIRTHGLLSPTLVAQVAAWRDAGFSDEEARGLVVYRELGILPEGKKTGGDRPALKTLSTALFSASAAECDRLTPAAYGSTTELVGAYARAGGDWERLAHAVEKAPADVQRNVVLAAWSLVCR
jgi:hypothetical protein